MRRIPLDNGDDNGGEVMGILKKVQKQYQSLLASITQAAIHIKQQFTSRRNLLMPPK